MMLRVVVCNSCRKDAVSQMFVSSTRRYFDNFDPNQYLRHSLASAHELSVP